MKKVLLSLLVLLGCFCTVSAQNRTVTGKVTDEKGMPIEGASIVTNVKTIGTKTNAEGVYSLVVTPQVKSLTASYVNYEGQTSKATNLASINFSLQQSDKRLGEVVVTGYTTRRKGETVGASSKVLSSVIAQVPNGSFDQTLQGRAPGLYIASGSGQPGATARVNIRGVGSISGGSNPLYIIDGIQIEAAVFNTLNPNDFESVDVLKDAATAGQYGSRGGNGVIVITTKKGKAGKTKIQYRGQMGFSEPPALRNVQMMNTAERLKYEEDFLGPFGVIGATTTTGYPGWDYSPKNPAYQASTPAQKLVFDRLLDSVKQINTNWADIFFKRSQFRQHELNASGGSDKLTFFTSLANYNQKGVLDRSSLDRYTYRGNLTFKTDKLTASLISSAGYSVTNGIESEAGVALANPIAAAFLELPYRKLNRADGKINTAAGQTGANAYDRIYTTTSRSEQFKGNLGINLQLEIWKGIYVKTNNGVDYRNIAGSRIIDPNSFLGGQIAQGFQGSYNESTDEAVSFTNTTGVGYNRKFAEKHKIAVQVLSESVRMKRRSFNATGFGLNRTSFNSPIFITQGTSTNNSIPLIGGQKFISGISSLFSLLDYTFDNRFTLSLVARKDVFSRVPVNNETKTGSIGLAWNATQENFFKKQTFLQDLKFRASFGSTANINALLLPTGGAAGENGFNGDFPFLSAFGPASYAGTPSLVPTNPGNPDAKIERQRILNVGVDFAIWKNRVRVIVDAYKKESVDQFVSQPISRTTGFNSLSTNAGKLENRGVDFDVKIDAIKKANLLVTFGLNGGFLRNRVTDLGGLPDIPGGTGVARVGYPLGSHFIVGYIGVNPQTGAPIYQDINGNPTTEYSATNNRAEFGTFLPKFTGGASLDIVWKGFDISALLSTAQGVKRFNNESFFYETTTANFQFNKRVDLLNSWTKPGDQANFQRVNTVRQFSSRDVQDASFIRFRNLQVGYTFNFKERAKVRGFRIWGQGQNLYTWTKWQGFDPEESNNIATYEFPNPKTYTIGLDINF
jgi:TonB-linked SusC/RagA family outer membrane protein